MGYFIVEGVDPGDLARKVNEHRKQGARLIGGVTPRSNGETLYQAMESGDNGPDERIREPARGPVRGGDGGKRGGRVIS